MASVGEGDCHKDPNFAVICSFFDKYSTSLGLPEISYADLQKYLEDTSNEVSKVLIDIHVRLLRRIGKSTVTPERFEKNIIKFIHHYSEFDAWEVESYGYRHAKLDTKLRILKTLLECQFDYNVKFKEKVNESSAEDMRFLPIGRDREGQAYWYFLDKDMNLLVYKEEQDDDAANTWQLVCSDRQELAKLVNRLQNDSRHQTEDKQGDSQSSKEGSHEKDLHKKELTIKVEENGTEGSVKDSKEKFIEIKIHKCDSLDPSKQESRESKPGAVELISVKKEMDHSEVKTGETLGADIVKNISDGNDNFSNDAIEANKNNVHMEDLTSEQGRGDEMKTSDKLNYFESGRKRIDDKAPLMVTEREGSAIHAPSGKKETSKTEFSSVKEASGVVLNTPEETSDNIQCSLPTVISPCPKIIGTCPESSEKNNQMTEVKTSTMVNKDGEDSAPSYQIEVKSKEEIKQSPGRINKQHITVSDKVSEDHSCSSNYVDSDKLLENKILLEKPEDKSDHVRVISVNSQIEDHITVISGCSPSLEKSPVVASDEIPTDSKEISNRQKMCENVTSVLTSAEINKSITIISSGKDPSNCELEECALSKPSNASKDPPDKLDLDVENTTNNGKDVGDKIIDMDSSSEKHPTVMSNSFLGVTQNVSREDGTQALDLSNSEKTASNESKEKNVGESESVKLYNHVCAGEIIETSVTVDGKTFETTVIEGGAAMDNSVTDNKLTDTSVSDDKANETSATEGNKAAKKSIADKSKANETVGDNKVIDTTVAKVIETSISATDHKAPTTSTNENIVSEATVTDYNKAEENSDAKVLSFAANKTVREAAVVEDKVIATLITGDCKSNETSVTDSKKLTESMTTETSVTEGKATETSINFNKDTETSVTDNTATETSDTDNKNIEASVTNDKAAETSVTETSDTDNKNIEASVTNDKASETSVTDNKKIEASITDDKAAETSVTETSDTDNKNIEPSVTNDKAAETSVTDDKAAETSVTDDKNIEASVTDNKVAETSVTDNKNIETSATDKKKIEPSVTDDKAAETSVTDNKNIETSATDNKKIEPSVTDDKAAETSVPDNKKIEASVTDDKAAETSVTDDKNIEASVTDDKATETSVTDNKKIEASVTDDKATETSVSDKKNIETSITDDKVTETSVTENKDTETSITDKKIEASVADDKATETSVTEDKAIKTSKTSFTDDNIATETSVTDINAIKTSKTSVTDDKKSVESSETYLADRDKTTDKTVIDDKNIIETSVSDKSKSTETCVTGGEKAVEISVKDDKTAKNRADIKTIDTSVIDKQSCVTLTKEKEKIETNNALETSSTEEVMAVEENASRITELASTAVEEKVSVSDVDNKEDKNLKSSIPIEPQGDQETSAEKIEKKSKSRGSKGSKRKNKSEGVNKATKLDDSSKTVDGKQLDPAESMKSVSNELPRNLKRSAPEPASDDLVDSEPNGKRAKQAVKTQKSRRGRNAAARGRAARMAHCETESDDSETPLSQIKSRRQEKLARSKAEAENKKSLCEQDNKKGSKQDGEENVPSGKRAKKKKPGSSSEPVSEEEVTPAKKGRNLTQASKPNKKTSGTAQNKVAAKKQVPKTQAKSQNEAEDLGIRRSLRVRQLKAKRPPTPSSPSECSEEDDDETEDDNKDNDFFDTSFTPEEESGDEEFKPKGRNFQRQAARTGNVNDEEVVNDDTPCVKCGKYNHPEMILLCDKCDAGYHTACLRPPLMLIPDGDWFCPPCEHFMLITKLLECLQTLDIAMKKKDRLNKRQERLAYVGINISNILHGDRKTTVDGKTFEDDTESKDNNASDAVDESESSSTESEVPKRTFRSERLALRQAQKRSRHEKHKLRRAMRNQSPEGEVLTKRTCRLRNAVSYQFKEFDELISNAIEDDKPLRREKPPGIRRGKDMSNILGASDEEDEKIRLRDGENSCPPPVLKKRSKRKLTKLDSDEDPDEDEESEEFRLSSEDDSSEASDAEEEEADGASTNSLDSGDWKPKKTWYNSHSPSHRPKRKAKSF
ncbi:hypothetical protein Btru_038123, partial [Bulinus truncatus]